MVDLGPILNHRLDLARKIIWIKRCSPENGFSCRLHKSGPDLVYANHGLCSDQKQVPSGCAALRHLLTKPHLSEDGRLLVSRVFPVSAHETN